MQINIGGVQFDFSGGRYLDVKYFEVNYGLFDVPWCLAITKKDGTRYMYRTDRKEIGSLPVGVYKTERKISEAAHGLCRIHKRQKSKRYT